MSIFKRENGEWVKKTAFQITGGSWKQISSAEDTPIEPDVPATPSLVYTLSSDGTYYIVGTGFTSIYEIEKDEGGGNAGSGLNSAWNGGKLVIPSIYNGLPVKGIAPKSFQNIVNITEVYISDGITTIGHRCFQSISINDTTMTSCRLPETLTSLGGEKSDYDGRVFWGRAKLSHINIPKGLVVIPQYTFYNCSSLKTINMPNVTSIALYAFGECSALETVNMPNIKDIGQVAFNTKSVTLYDMSEIKSVVSLYNCDSVGHKSGCVLRVPNSLLEAMQRAVGWIDIADVVWEGV